MRYAAGFILYACALSAQVPAKVDFGRDVQPIFKTYCIGCHGPSQQQHNLRLDRRRDAMRGGTIPVIGPGNTRPAGFICASSVANLDCKCLPPGL